MGAGHDDNWKWLSLLYPLLIIETSSFTAGAIFLLIYSVLITFFIFGKDKKQLILANLLSLVVGGGLNSDAYGRIYIFLRNIITNVLSWAFNLDFIFENDLNTISLSNRSKQYKYFLEYYNFSFFSENRGFYKAFDSSFFDLMWNYGWGIAICLLAFLFTYLYRERVFQKYKLCLVKQPLLLIPFIVLITYFFVVRIHIYHAYVLSFLLLIKLIHNSKEEVQSEYL